MNVLQLGVFAGIFIVAAYILFVTAWRAMLFLSPSSIRIEEDCKPEQMFEEMPATLEKLSNFCDASGFVPLGRHVEKPRFTRGTESYDFAHEASGTFCTLYEGRDGGSRLYLLTPLEHGFVVTANYRRPAREVAGRYYSGGLEEYPPDRVLKAHLRRLEMEKLQPVGPFTMEARLEAGRRWFATWGSREVRAQNLFGFMWAAGTIAAVAWGLWNRR